MALVLITGATGEVARGVLPLLVPRFQLRLLATNTPVDDPRSVRADILDRAALIAAMQGVDAVLHLAVASGHTGTFEDAAFNDVRFDVNVKGTFHVFDAARQARVRRVVHISSVMVTWGEAQALHRSVPGAQVAGDAAPSPVGTYALTKTLGEEIARYFGHSGDLEVLTLRIAAPLDLEVPGLRSRPVRPQQIPLEDLAQAFILALTVPWHRYEVVTVAGASVRCLWSLDAARRVLGYMPKYSLDALGLQFAEDPFAVAAT